jgi:hypothetical protein
MLLDTQLYGFICFNLAEDFIMKLLAAQSKINHFFFQLFRLYPS